MDGWDGLALYVFVRDAEKNCFVREEVGGRRGVIGRTPFLLSRPSVQCSCYFIAVVLVTTLGEIGHHWHKGTWHLSA
jgi:hypothetical protein